MMNLLKLTISCLLIFILSYGASSAQTSLLITADDTCTGGGSNLSSLYSADPQTGATSLIGPIGFNGVTGMAVLGDGRLVASARADANGDRISILIEIDPLTGQGTLIGTIGNNEEGGCGRTPDLTYDAATDTLYGIGFRCIPGNSHGNITELLRINQTTGLGTTIGQTGFFGGGNGLAISAGGTLFSSEDEEFLTLNPLTGQGTLVANHDQGDFVMSAMDFHPRTRELFGIEFRFSDGADLVTVNTSTAVTTEIGELPPCSDALVFFTSSPSNVPTLSEWGLIAMASILGIVGFMVARRRKVTA
ncbi:MAG TPA: hypothetical protein DD405_03150 [Desulfobacteraceae bacterium]|nr:hypothetical protein [Desulfobacteraceae bacterium]